MHFFSLLSLFVLSLSMSSCIGQAKKGNGVSGIMEILQQEEETPIEVVIVKDFTYDKYTLEDEYPYKDTTRRFQWDKIQQTLTDLEKVQSHPQTWATLQNYKNLNGIAPLVEDPEKDEYNSISDAYGVSRYQSIPLYEGTDFETPVRYARDGSLFRHLGDSLEYTKVCSMVYDGQWYVPNDYVKVLTAPRFNKVIFVDRTNQNIATMEKGDTAWYVRSMNPATTGLHRPPYQQETPLGVYVIQEKKPKMFYTHDGTSDIAGFAPYASRFTRGGYIHGVPLNSVDVPVSNYIEYSSTLGTTPRSHMCVRNATSHAKFVYDWAPALESLVVVIE